MNYVVEDGRAYFAEPDHVAATAEDMRWAVVEKRGRMSRLVAMFASFVDAKNCISVLRGRERYLDSLDEVVNDDAL